MEAKKNIFVIGGGAAGFFAAITCASVNPNLNVIILEKSGKLLSKVRVSGGGRCNVTHACFDLKDLVKYYPRGNREMLGPFYQFSPKDTIDWFHSKGVLLKTEKDGRMFPVTDQSATIIDCLMKEANSLGVSICLNTGVKSIEQTDKNNFGIILQDDRKFIADAIVLASGGSPTLKGFEWLSELKHTIIPPVPSLFTFNLSDNSITQLMGISVEDVRVKISGTKFVTEGPLLITHWGMSGPVILKLSSHAARKLEECKYLFLIEVNWLKEYTEEELRAVLNNYRKELNTKKISSSNPFNLPKRLWEYLLSKSIKRPAQEWAQLTKEDLRKLNLCLIADEYAVKGKTTFKEEFVTCGGVSLKEVDFKTMQSKLIPGLYFAGEILDIDAVTGGFNFQSAWTTGFISGKSIADSF